jgi:hypothetical protein
MSSAAAAADAPEEFAALADYTIDDFMSEAAPEPIEYSKNYTYPPPRALSGSLGCRSR